MVQRAAPNVELTPPPPQVACWRIRKCIAKIHVCAYLSLSRQGSNVFLRYARHELQRGIGRCTTQCHCKDIRDIFQRYHSSISHEWLCRACRLVLAPPQADCGYEWPLKETTPARAFGIFGISSEVLHFGGER